MKYAGLLFILIFLLIPGPVRAFSDPLATANNIYGIHIVNENDLGNAARLVNSNGGDWGYVTMVITENDRNVGKWQGIFDNMRRLHLIPIIRLATAAEGESWRKPDPNDIPNWVNFLSSLNWVVKNRYVVIFNEPNHATEWGNRVSPEEYTQSLALFAASLKKASRNFFILPAGLDASAPDGNQTMDELNFLNRMVASNPGILDLIDGWVSHSYPNPGFIGNVEAGGRGSLKTYSWELDQLHALGLKKNLPVFITETGWAHQDGITFGSQYLSDQTVSDYIKKASQTVWNDSRIAAVTPFLLNYQSEPFSHFSWQKVGSDEFYPQYQSYQDIPKSAGKPEIIKMFDFPLSASLAFLTQGKDAARTELKNPPVLFRLSTGLFSLAALFFPKS